MNNSYKYIHFFGELHNTCSIMKPNEVRVRRPPCLCEAATKYFKDLRIRADFSDGDPGFEESFYILRHTTCPAVLVENFFYDKSG